MIRQAIEDDRLPWKRIQVYQPLLKMFNLFLKCFNLLRKSRTDARGRHCHNIAKLAVADVLILIFQVQHQAKNDGANEQTGPPPHFGSAEAFGPLRQVRRHGFELFALSVYEMLVRIYWRITSAANFEGSPHTLPSLHIFFTAFSHHSHFLLHVS